MKGYPGGLRLGPGWSFSPYVARWSIAFALFYEHFFRLSNLRPCFFQRRHPYRQSYTLAGPSLMDWMTGKGGALTDRSAALIGPGECGSFCSPLFRRRIFRFIKKPDEFFFIRHRCPFDQWAPWGAPPPIRTGGVGLFVACEGQRIRQGINLHASHSSTTMPCRLRKRHRQNERRDQPGTNRQGPFQEQGGPLKLASGIALPSLAEAM